MEEAFQVLVISIVHLWGGARRGVRGGVGREGGRRLLNVIEGMRMVCDIAGEMVYQEHSAQ